MARLINSGFSLPFQCWSNEGNAFRFYNLILEKMKSAGIDTSNIQDSKTLLKKVGFSQSGRKGLICLSSDEIKKICEYFPHAQELWEFFVRELQVLLSKMNLIRIAESSLEGMTYMGRPYITSDLACVFSKLARLRFLHAKGVASLAESKMRSLLEGYEKELTLLQYLDANHLCDERTGMSITTLSAIRLLELYRDVCVALPILKRRINFDDYELHMLETGDFSWMDDGGTSYLEAIRDIPYETLYDEIPMFWPVLDWFIATKPVLDKNQTRQGWAYLVESSDRWHDRDLVSLYDEKALAEYPGWSCWLADDPQGLLDLLPSDSPYQIIPLTTPLQMLRETESMHHCVVAYFGSCISGNVRIFSVRSKFNDQHVATAELKLHGGRWELVQLKGKCNQELIHTMKVSSHPLAVAMRALVSWYNLRALTEFRMSESSCVGAEEIQFQIAMGV